MQQDRTNRRTCPYCGAELPEEASFCPFCARSVNQRQNVSPPSVRWRKNLLPLIDAPGAVGTEGGVLRQRRAAVGTFVFHGGILLFLFLTQRPEDV